jgi:hypothetical protein
MKYYATRCSEVQHQASAVRQCVDYPFGRPIRHFVGEYVCQPLPRPQPRPPRTWGLFRSVSPMRQSGCARRYRWLHIFQSGIFMEMHLPNARFDELGPAFTFGRPQRQQWTSPSMQWAHALRRFACTARMDQSPRKGPNRSWKTVSLIL